MYTLLKIVIICRKSRVTFLIPLNFTPKLFRLRRENCSEPDREVHISSSPPEGAVDALLVMNERVYKLDGASGRMLDLNQQNKRKICPKHVQSCRICHKSVPAVFTVFASK